MDSKATISKLTGATPGKLALIGVLAVILIAVLYLQFGRSGAGQATSRTAPRKRPESKAVQPATPVAAPTMPGQVPRKKMRNMNRWTPPELAAVIRYDPFALPAAFPRPRRVEEPGALADVATGQSDPAAEQVALEQQRAQMQQRLEELRHQGVRVIVKGRDEYVAVVGDQEIRVGDQIQGFTVVAIDSDGVKVAWERSK